MRSFGDHSDRGFNICLIDPKTRNVRTLYKIHSGSEADLLACAWSPDGGRIAFAYVVYDHGFTPAYRVVILRPDDGAINTFMGAAEFAWAPDGLHLFLTLQANTYRIVDLVTKKHMVFEAPILAALNPYFIDKSHVIGTVNTEPWVPWKFVLLDSMGKVFKRITLNSAKIDYDSLNVYDPGFDDVFWHRLPNSRSHLMLESVHAMSDGSHRSCFIVNMQTSRIKPIGNYEFDGFSKDGRQCLLSGHEWVGEYKRGGQRVGPLEIYTFRTGKTHRITSRLVDIGGADWYR